MVIQYNPVAGLTVKQALIKAKQLSLENNKTVMAIINDIVMIVDKDIDIAKALTEYHHKANMRFYVAHLKRAVLQNEL